MKHIIFDRDGTLIKHHHYLSDVTKVELLPDVKECLETLIYEGYILHLHTNQSGVSRNYYKYEDVISCNNRMIELLGFGPSIFESICIAIDLKTDDTYRKPSTKFGLELIRKYNIEPKSITYIGDSVSDLITAKNLNANGIGLNTGLRILNQEILNDNDLKFNIYQRMKDCLIELI
jgi:D-glycero-D-manno-heptose 1,7-bisphosphate phosphatase